MNDDSNGETYCVHMLQANSIDGIIKPEPRTIDNRVLYYYDITSKQPIETIYIKNTITYKHIKGLFVNLADLAEQTYEYLLNEDDLLLEPEYIYVELATGQVNVCYLPGYNNDIRKQITTLIEYIMNKVEYKDKEAVLYIYKLYAVCRDEGFSFNNLILAIRDNKPDNHIKTENRKGLNLDAKKNNNQVTAYNMDKPEYTFKEQNSKNQIHKNQIPKKKIPIMMEKVSDDSEQYYYPIRAYIYTCICTIGAILVLVISINTKVIYSSFGNRIDYGKLMALILILLIIIGYLVKDIWKKNNRLTKIISKQEYIDPRIDYIDHKTQFEDQDDYIPQKSKSKVSNLKENVPDPTVLLNVDTQSSGSCLEPENRDTYDVIQINENPFVIGKQKDNVDYFLDNEVVSRYHVKITKEKDIYFITDLNSTNGTSLNEKSLPCYQRFELMRGDEVSIAGIKYLFQI
jgi:hypothetical protein